MSYTVIEFYAAQILDRSRKGIKEAAKKEVSQLTTRPLRPYPAPPPPRTKWPSIFLVFKKSYFFSYYPSQWPERV